LHAVTDETGRPIRHFMTAGEVSGYTGAAELLSSNASGAMASGPSHGLKANRCRATDRGYDADWFHESLKKKG
jgi:transposase